MDILGKISPMSRVLRAAAGLGLFVSLLGCPAMTPQGGGAASIQKVGGGEAPTSGGASDESPSDATDDASGASAGTPPQEFAAADAKTQPGGVSALPADVTGEGDFDYKVGFNFTLTGTAEPECRETNSQKTRYQVSGTIGAVLLDGTVVPLLHCEVLRLRFQAVVGTGDRCEDIPVNADCSFSGEIAFPNGVIPKPSLYAMGGFPTHPITMQNGIPIGDLTYQPVSEPLAACQSPSIPDSSCGFGPENVSIPINPKILQKLKIKIP